MTFYVCYCKIFMYNFISNNKTSLKNRLYACFMNSR